MSFHLTINGRRLLAEEGDTVVWGGDYKHLIREILGPEHYRPPESRSAFSHSL